MTCTLWCGVCTLSCWNQSRKSCDMHTVHCALWCGLCTLSRYNKSVETVTLRAINDFILLCETPNISLKRKLSVDHVGVLFDAMLYFVNVQVRRPTKQKKSLFWEIPPFPGLVFPSGVKTNMHYLQRLGSCGVWHAVFSEHCSHIVVRKCSLV